MPQVPIPGFEMYRVSDTGHVFNFDGRPMTISQNNTGNYYVRLTGEDGIQKSRSVALLVATAFVERPSERFNTPIHKDGDPSNNKATNLLWRPRWYAVRYLMQFRTPDGPIAYEHPIFAIDEPKRVFDNMRDLVTTEGLLAEDVLYSIRSGTPVWPGYKIYDALPLDDD